MKPTNEDAQPRRDGWHEHRGTWEEVTVGTVIASEKRTERWEIIALGHGQQVEYGHTLWMRARDQATGAEKSLEPRLKTNPVTILTQDPADTKTPAPTDPADTAAILLLVEKLGARLLASRDNVTGEVACPSYAMGYNHLDEIGNRALFRGEVEHLQLAHGIDTSELESMAWDEQIRQITIWHARAHDPAYPQWGKGGFPHRHTPEDLSIM